MASALCHIAPARAGLRAVFKPAAAMASGNLARGVLAVRGAATLPEYPCVLGTATLPELPYAYDALEPAISARIMEIHHSKHHQAYVKGLNTTREAIADASSKGDREKLKVLSPLLMFHGGGHINHSLFWESLAPSGNGGGGEPTGALATAINTNFGSFEKFKEAFVGQLMKVQGSGWVWLVKRKEDGSLILVARDNQNPVRLQYVHPLLGIDAWEHAYYLQYENRKNEYFNAIFDVINWAVVAKRFEEGSLV